MKYNQTSLRCHWQTHAMVLQFKPTMLYTDVDSGCDKLVTDERHSPVYHTDRPA